MLSFKKKDKGSHWETLSYFQIQVVKIHFGSFPLKIVKGYLFQFLVKVGQAEVRDYKLRV